MGHSQAQVVPQLTIWNGGFEIALVCLEVSSSLDGYYFTQVKDTTKLLSRADFTDNMTYDTPLEPNVRPNAHDGECIHYATHYRKFVGSLVYLTVIHLYILYAVNIIKKFMATPWYSHFSIILCILHHLKGTLFCGLNFSLSPLMIHASTNVN